MGIPFRNQFAARKTVFFSPSIEINDVFFRLERVPNQRPRNNRGKEAVSPIVEERRENRTLRAKNQSYRPRVTKRKSQIREKRNPKDVNDETSAFLITSSCD